MTDQPVLCRKCKGRAEVAVQANGDKTVVCTPCGVSAPYDEIKGELAEQAAEYLRQRLLSGFRKPGSKWKVTESVRPKREYRFFVDLEAHPPTS